MITDSKPQSPSALANPWVQLILGIVCMAAVANMQYGWTLFVDPIDQKYHWGRPAIQFAFSLFVFLETWLVPIEGYLVDRFGPRIVVIIGAVMVAVAWTINSQATSLTLLYIAAAVGGIGTGAVYGTCVGNALKWFPGRRGLAAGCTAAGFGIGAALTIAPIATMIASDGYEHAFLFFGVLQGVIVLIAALGLLVPASSLLAAAPKKSQSSKSFTPTEVLKSPVFYVMYVMFVLVAAGGLILIANMAPMAKDLKIAKAAVDIFGMSVVAGTFAIKAQRIFDGFGRPFFGWVSDQIGRENTMAIAFVIGAGALFLLSQTATTPLAFVIFSTLYFAVFGEIYSLFPATQGDTFGAQYATANAGMLYTAKGTGSLLVAAGTAFAAAHGWNSILWLAMCGNLVAAGLGLFVLKPMRTRHFEAIRAGVSSGIQAATPVRSAT
ncbi:MAG TPA: oxalate/formate MFS antiporter [Steroidobacteraceae bacterium]|nr:oxalate/formate MFS antiporter [Steroidobacteraceae bacterium]